MLAEVGYTSAMFGKWHLGHTQGRFPTDHGFDEWYGPANSTDESAWTSLHGFGKSGVEPAHIWQGKKGEEASKVRVYDLELPPD